MANSGYQNIGYWPPGVPYPSAPPSTGGNSGQSGQSRDSGSSGPSASGGGYGKPGLVAPTPAPAQGGGGGGGAEVKKGEPQPETSTPTTKATGGEVLSVTKTTGQDKYAVKYIDKTSGELKSSLLTGEQVKAMGGALPTGGAQVWRSDSASGYGINGGGGGGGGGGTTPTTTPKNSEVLSVVKTTGADLYKVRYIDAASGELRTALMRGARVAALGGLIPPGTQQYTQKYAGASILGDSRKALSTDYFVKELVEKQGMSEAEARRITLIALRQPNAAELSSLPVGVKRSIANDLLPGKVFLIEGEGITPQLLTSEDIKKIQSAPADSPEYHNYLKALRLISPDAKSETEFKADLRANDPYLYDVYVGNVTVKDAQGNVLKGGVEAYNTAVEKRNTDLAAIYERSETEFKADLRANDPYLYQVYVGGVTVEDENGNVLKGGIEAYDAVVARRNTIYTQLEKHRSDATAALADYGFVRAQYPEGGAPFEMYEQEGAKQMTIPNLGKFVRENPNGLQMLRDYGYDYNTLNEIQEYNNELQEAQQAVEDYFKSGEDYGGYGRAIDNALLAQEINVHPAGAALNIKYNLWVDEKSGQALTDKEIAERRWGALKEEQKQAVAGLVAADYMKGSVFAERTKSMSQVSEKAGLIGSIVYGPILPVIQPIAKQITLDEAKAYLTQKYGPEFKEFSDYLRSNGTFDVDRLGDKLDSDYEYASKTLGITGYPDKQDLLDSLTSYNEASRVTAKEWAIAGLVAALDVLMVAGGSVAAGAVGKTIEETIPVSLGVVQAPDVVKALRSPIQLGEKALVGVTEAMMFLGLAGPTIRGLQFLEMKNDVKYVPLRSLSMEKSTARVVFTPRQLKAMREAGVTEADIMKAGTEINRQLLAKARVAEVSLGPVKVRVRNVPYQKSVGLSLFNATPDITVFDRGGEVPVFKKLYTAAKVALEPMERSYITGERASHPGIVEIKITDPELLAKIGPQEKLIYGSQLEPEAAIPSVAELQGMGYMLEPIPGPAGKGITFDAHLGKVEIRRYTLSKMVENPTGLKTEITGQIGDTGTVALGDLHGTRHYRNVYNDINSAYGKEVVKGNPNKPLTWRWDGAKETVVVLGDSIDRGPSYNLWRETLNRLSDEARAKGGKVERLIGNHELAYLTDDAIRGIEYTDATRAVIRRGIKEDVMTGKVKAAVASDGKLYTHAGVSLGAFPEYAGKSAEFIANDLNKKLMNAVRRNRYGDKMFAVGRTERGPAHSSITNAKEQGGIFWLRPQEALREQLDLGFTQVVGHSPGAGVRRLWGGNYVEVDVLRREGGVGAFADTPYAKTRQVEIGLAEIEGPKGTIRTITRANITGQAMRDTVADVFMGWDGRIQAVENLKQNRKAVDALLESIDEQIAQRKAAGDTVGVKLLKQQAAELTTPEGRDYIYGGIGLWRDLVMGRQNSVKVLDHIKRASWKELRDTAQQVERAKKTITEMSDTDIQRLFGRNRELVLKNLDTSSINWGRSREGILKTLSDAELNKTRGELAKRAKALEDIVDDGLERNIEQYLDRKILADKYAQTLQDRLTAQAEIAEVGYGLERYTEAGGIEPERLPEERELRAPEAREERALEREPERTERRPEEREARTYEGAEERELRASEAREERALEREPERTERGPEEREARAPERSERVVETREGRIPERRLGRIERAPERTPRAPERTPRAPERTSRAPERAPRAPERQPRGPERTPRPPERTPDRIPDRPPVDRLPYPIRGGRIGETPKPQPRIIKGHGPMAEQARRAIVANANAAVTYRRGELGGKRVGVGDDAYNVGGKGVWHTWLKRSPESNWERVIIMGAKPEGAIYASGPESAQRTMQRLSGLDEINIMEDTGAVDTVIKGKSGEKKIQAGFVKDKSVKRQRGKEVYRNERVVMKEAEGKDKNRRIPGGKPVTKELKPRAVDLGAGVVREGTRQHIGI